MELETNTPTSDDARLLAQAKKLTLQPIHADVVADEMPDSVIVAQHLTQGPVANIDIDIEQNTPLITPAEAETTGQTADATGQTRLFVLTGVGFVLLALVAFFVIAQQ
jgi:hypothetical protein